MIGVYVTFQYNGDFDRARVEKVAKDREGCSRGWPGSVTSSSRSTRSRKRAVNFYVWEAEDKSRGLLQ